MLDSGAFKLATSFADRETWFHWSSGVLAPTYTDCRELQTHISLYSTVVTQLERSIRTHVPVESFDAVIGVANGGLLWSVPVALKLTKDHAYVRRTAKEYGMQRRIEGSLPSGTRCVVVDDLLATATTALSAIDELIAAGLQPIAVHTIVSWQRDSATRAFDQRSIPVWSLLGPDELLGGAFERGLISERCRQELLFFHRRPVEHEFDESAFLEDGPR